MTTTLPERTRHKLSPENRAEIVDRATTHSLRQLARDFGVSHETIRSIVLQATDE